MEIGRLHEPFLLMFIAFIIYKIFDKLIRIPKLDLPMEKRNIVVTGCDSGFGNKFAKRMASGGFNVFAACLTEEGKNELSLQNPENLKPFIMNVTDAESIRKGFDFVVSQIGQSAGLWALINNAGVTGTSGPLEWFNKKHFTQVLDVNFHGMFQTTITFLPLLKRTHGRVVNTCSIVGRIAVPYSGPYTTSKFAAEGLSDAMRREFYAFDISVHIIEPGQFATMLTEPKRICGALNECWNNLSTDLQEEYGSEFLKGAVETLADFMPMAASRNLDIVLDCYEHAITARYPRKRYMPGYDSRFLYWPLSLMPEWIPDFIMYAACRIKLPKPKSMQKNKQL